ncbi:MAG: hypothetical protein HRU30_20335 [Rhodobacteraceae bacterium]|nr:hypothetical protein [Paracoccaceae bacterium]
MPWVLRKQDVIAKRLFFNFTLARVAWATRFFLAAPKQVLRRKEVAGLRLRSKCHVSTPAFFNHHASHPAGNFACGPYALGNSKDGIAPGQRCVENHLVFLPRVTLDLNNYTVLS